MKQLAVAITAALMLGAVGASAAAADPGAHRVDRRIHQHQGTGPTNYHRGNHAH